MNDDVILGLEQFIAAAVSQHLAGVATKDDIARLEVEVTGTKGDVARIERKIDDLQEAVAEAPNNINDAVEEQIEKRLAAHVQRYHGASA